MHPQAREPAGVTARPLWIIFDRSWQVPKDWKKANVTPIFKKGKEEDPGNYMLVSITLNLEQLILDTTYRHMNSKTTNRSSQHGFTKLCLTNLINFYDEMSSLVD